MASHTIDLLEHAIEVAKKANLQVRFDWLDGKAGGLCRIGNQSWLFLDLSLPVSEQLTQVANALRRVHLAQVEMHPDLSRLVCS